MDSMKGGKYTDHLCSLLLGSVVLAGFSSCHLACSIMMDCTRVILQKKNKNNFFLRFLLSGCFITMTG